MAQRNDTLKKELKMSRRRIDRLLMSGNKLFAEMEMRGVALEKISKLVNTWQNHPPEHLYDLLSGIVDEYQERCTEKNKKT